MTSSLGLIEEMHDSASPIMAFINERCAVGEVRSVDKGELYFAWRGWCLTNGHEPGSKESLSKKLIACLGRDVIDPEARVRRGKQKQVRVYRGIELLPPSGIGSTK